MQPSSYSIALLAESVPAIDSCCTVILPDVNICDVDVDFVTDVRSVRGGIIRVEEIGGVAYTLTCLSPENGGGFNVVGGSETSVRNMEEGCRNRDTIYDLNGRIVGNEVLSGVYIKDGKKILCGNK